MTYKEYKEAHSLTNNQMAEAFGFKSGNTIRASRYFHRVFPELYQQWVAGTLKSREPEKNTVSGFCRDFARISAGFDQIHNQK